MYGAKCQNLILTLTLQKGFKGCVRYFSCLCWNSAKVRIATSVTSRVASFLTLAATILSTMLAMVMILLPNGIAQYVITVIVFLFLMVTLICLSRQPITDERLSFKVPCVPWLPMFSVFVNVYLMMKLSEATWIRFAVWLVLGVLVSVSTSMEK